jgi:putative membrane protein
MVAAAIISCGVLVGAQSPGAPQTPAAPGTPSTPPTPASPGRTVTPGQADTKADTKGRSADASFIMEAAMGGMTEVELGKLATEKATNPKVKMFGQRMVDDHGKAGDELKTLAASKQISVPASLDAKHKSMHDKLAGLSGADFDRAYVKDMVADHKKDVEAFNQEATKGKDPDVKAWAAKTLPTLREHLRMIQEIDGDLGKSVASR